MRKAFTLIEMLAVIIIISIIMLVLIPVVTQSLKESKEKVYNAMIKKMISATSDWMIKNSEYIKKKYQVSSAN